jgi:5-formyltetrahydrofolate cyclo-ligase
LLLWFESNGPHRHRRVAPPDSPLSARSSLRASLRALRRSIPPAERRRAATRVARNADRELHLRPGWRVAAYWATAEELDAAALIALAERRGCRVFLPQIERRRLGRRMRFLESTGRHRANRYGIPEPEGPQFVSPRCLDVVFLPLIGFDRSGMRLGAGAGYYDRAFAFRRIRTAWHAPLLVGIGFALQEVARLAPAAHDVPLDLVITEREVIRCAPAPTPSSPARVSRGSQLSRAD